MSDTGKSGGKWKPFATGGLASMMAACVSHPLDLLKVRLQVAGEFKVQGNMGGAATATAPKPSLVGVVGNLARSEGVAGFYKGLSASLLRQGSYSTARFGVYGAAKNFKEERANGKALSTFDLIQCAVLGGAVGGFVGCPADVALIRMQADGRLAPELRRNYKNAFDGLFRIASEEGVTTLYRGLAPTVLRGVAVTIGQLVSYDIFKRMLLSNGLMEEGMPLHFTASTMAGGVATLLTQPIDVVKTRMMNANAAEGVMYKNEFECIIMMLRHEGPRAFFKGSLPTFIRLGPHTVCTLLFAEQLKRLFAPL